MTGYPISECEDTKKFDALQDSDSKLDLNCFFNAVAFEWKDMISMRTDSFCCMSVLQRHMACALTVRLSPTRSTAGIRAGSKTFRHSERTSFCVSRHVSSSAITGSVDTGYLRNNRGTRSSDLSSITVSSMLWNMGVGI